MNLQATAAGGLVGAFASARKYKKDIAPTTAKDTKKALEMVRGLDTKTYRYKWEGKDEPKRMGLMADDAPASIVTPDREGLDVGRWLGLLTVATRALAQRRA